MTHFTIHELPLGGGTLAISPMPGRTRHYGTDRARLLDWGPELVITTCTLPELARKGSASLGEDLAAHGIAWRHFPVEDFGVPQDARDWPSISATVHAALARGGKVLVHCFGGCGRSGMVCLRLMIETGEAPDNALDRLRQARPCAVETEAQRLWAEGG